MKNLAKRKKKFVFLVFINFIKFCFNYGLKSFENGIEIID